MIKVNNKKKSSNENITQVSDVHAGSPAAVPTENQDAKMNENLDGVASATTSDDPNHQDNPTYPSDGMAEMKPTDNSTKNDNSEDFTDDKYVDVITELQNAGYKAKFYGSEGYYIEDKDSNDSIIRLVCRNLSEGFRLNVIGCLLDQSEVNNFVEVLNFKTKLMDTLNTILLGEIQDTSEMTSVDMSNLPAPLAPMMP